MLPGAIREGGTEVERGKYCFSSHKENCPWHNEIFNAASTKHPDLPPVSVVLTQDKPSSCLRSDRRKRSRKRRGFKLKGLVLYPACH